MRVWVGFLFAIFYNLSTLIPAKAGIQFYICFEFLSPVTVHGLVVERTQSNPPLAFGQSAPFNKGEN